MGKREELQAQLKDLRERLSNVRSDRAAAGESGHAVWNEQISMGMFDEDSDLARRAVELQGQVDAVEKQLAALPAETVAPDASTAIDFDAKAIPGANPSIIDEDTAFDAPEPSTPTEPDASLDYPALAIPGASPATSVDEDTAFEPPDPAPTPASGGGLPRALIGVPIAIVLLVGALVMRSTSAQVAADAATAAPATAARTAGQSAPASLAGVQSFDYTITPMRFSWDGTGIVNMGVSVNTGSVNSYKRDEVLTYTWTVEAGTCAKVIMDAPSTDHISIDFINFTDSRGRLAKCPGGPSYPLSVKLVIKDRWGAEYVRTFTGSTGEDANSRNIGDQIKVHHEGP